MKIDTDFVVDDYGSIVGITPITPAARDWLDENVESEPWQWLGCTLNVGGRYANDLIEGMQEDGLQM